MPPDNSDVPAGWVLASGADLFDFIRGVTFKKKDARPDRLPGTVGIVRANNIQDQALDLSDMVFVDQDFARDAQRLRGGDIVLATSSGSIRVVGKAARVSCDLPDYAFGAFCGLLRPASKELSDWLSAYTKTKTYRDTVSAAAKGVNINNLKASDLRALEIPLPPDGERRRVVQRLSDLETKAARAREALDAIPPLLEKFRQSVLAAAFRGDLTREWRARNPEVEPASVLLERIRAERRARWIEDAAEKARGRAEARARKAGKDWGGEDDARVLERERVKAAEKYVAPEPVDEEGLPGLPEGWSWARLEELTPADASIVYGIILPGPDVPDGVPYIRPADINGPGRVVDQLPRTSPEIAKKYERAALQPGDLVFSIVGTIGKWLIVPAGLDGANITQSSVRIRPASPFDAEYLLRALQCNVVERQMKRLLFGNAVQRLNVAHVRQLVVPVAPTGEREAMLARIQGALSTTQAVSDQVIDGRSQLASLDQSMLAKAFRGELVPQDPNDEPASVLLDRIRAEREVTEAEAKSKRMAARRPRKRAAKKKAAARKRRTTRAKDAT